MLKAIGNGIIVKKVTTDSEAEEKEMIGGLVVPTSEKGYETYKIVEVGQLVSAIRDLSNSHLIDVIYTYPNPGHAIKIKGEEYRVINASEILGYNEYDETPD